MTMQTTKTSRSYDQNQLKIICDHLCDNIESLFEYLDLSDIKYNGKMFVGGCPIHNGDNKSAFNLYPNGDFYRGNWRCRTHNCDKVFKGSIIGFIRGVLSNKKYNWVKDGDSTISFQETMNFVETFLGNDIGNIKVSKSDIDKKTFSSVVKNITETSVEIANTKISRHSIRQSLSIPSKYFIDRGFCSDILNKYDVGLCDKPEKEMYNRAVAPIYDHSYKYMVGCTGRSIFDKCSVCGAFHNPNNQCPADEDKWKYSKWKHNYQFKSQNHLYNFWFAKEHILASSTAILVESPGNVWRLEEAGIHNSLAMFGSNLSDRQKIILDGSGAMSLVVITDNDDAGDKAAKLIYDKCKNTYKIIRIQITKSDVAEMSLDDIQKEIKPYIKDTI